MSEHPFDELERIGSASVPTVDAGFADRLESDLRVRHGEHRRARLSPAGWRRAAFGLAAAAAVVAGVVGVSQLRVDDGEVPLEVTGPVADGVDAAEDPAAETTDDGTTGDGGDAAATDLSAGDPDDGAAVFEPTPTPTTEAGAVGPEPTAPDAATPDADTDSASGPADASTTPAPARASATPTPEPTRSTDAAVDRPSPTATPTPAVSVRPTEAPTPARPDPTPTTVRPAVTPSPRPSPTPPATSTPTPLPTATPAPVPFALGCEVRVEGDVIGVACEWQPPSDVDVGRFVLHRTRNGGSREVVATVRPPRQVAVDRDVEPGDRIVYVVSGLTGDSVRAVSERVVVQVPPA